MLCIPVDTSPESRYQELGECYPNKEKWSGLVVSIVPDSSRKDPFLLLRDYHLAFLSFKDVYQLARHSSQRHPGRKGPQEHV